MIAEQKAKELIERFKAFAYEYETGEIEDTVEWNAKQCALICVDEILNAIPATICGYMPEGGTAMEVDNPQKYFWLETKSFIENS